MKSKITTVVEVSVKAEIREVQGWIFASNGGRIPTESDAIHRMYISVLRDPDFSTYRRSIAACAPGQSRIIEVA